MSESRTVSASERHHKITKSLREIHTLLDEDSFGAEPRRLFAHVKVEFEHFERAPKALDSSLSEHVSAITSLYFLAKKRKETVTIKTEVCKTLESLADLIYVLSKIRGQQYVANKLSSDVYLVPQLVATLLGQRESCGPSEIYFLLLWLTRLVLVPFPLESVEHGLASKLFTIAQYNLGLHSTASKTQSVASAMLASLLTRSDASDLFTRYTESVVVDWPVLPRTNAQLGHLMALNQILKKSPSAQILALVPEIHANVFDHEISQLELEKTGIFDKGPRSSRINTMNALYLVKISAKLSKFAVGQRDFSRVASLINSTIELMHLMGDQLDASLRECMAKNMARTVAYLATKATNYAEQVITHFVNQLGIENLHDAVFSPDVHIEPTNLSVPRYHTVLLFLGFLALSKSLPEKFVPLLFSIAHKTAFISQRQYAWVQSSQIRDASCFCLWATFRMLSKIEFSKLSERYPTLVSVIFIALTRISLFDEDFTMRRCGIAVLQEFIGRFGPEFLPRVLHTTDPTRIGEFTVRFIEQFGASTLGNLSDSHDIVHILIGMGFPAKLFYLPLLEEIVAETSSFELQKLASRHLARAMEVSETEVTQLTLYAGDIPSRDAVVDLLVSSMERGTFSSLYALAELQCTGTVSLPITQRVSMMVKNISLKRDASLPFLGESVMHWLNAISDSATGNNEIFSDVVAKLQRIDATKGLVFEFQTHFSSVSVTDPQIFHNFLHQIRMGSKLLASSVLSLPLGAQEVSELCIILRDESVDAEIRATLLSTITAKTLNQDTSSVLSSALIDLLDDYTISDQGDVGSRVRAVCISLIATNSEIFRTMRQDLTQKLLRIAGETIDRLRISSFHALCDVYGVASYANNSDQYQAHYDIYFADLFGLYENIGCQIQNDEAVGLKEAFWKGLVHSAAASTGANTMINSSFRQVLKHLTSPEKLEDAFKIWVGILRVPPGSQVTSLDKRAQKTLLVTLNLIVKVFDSGVVVPSHADCNVLFVRAYNLHLNTKVIARIAPVIRIFEQMGTHPGMSEDLKMKCRKRLCWLSCNHPNGQVRMLASDSLFEVANEFCSADRISEILDQSQLESKRPEATTLSKLEHIFSTI